MGISGIIEIFSDLIGMLVPLFFTFGLIAFLWGIIKYIASGADEEGRRDARNMMIYGVIGVFVMVSVFGLARVIGNTFWVGSGGDADVPQFPDNL